MPTPFHKVILFGKRHREKQSVVTLLKLIALLKKLRVEVMVEEETATLLPDLRLKKVSEKALAQHGELIIVVGGDGSLLTAARVAAEQGLPVLGVNRGRLGFLTDIRPGALEEIGPVLQGHYQEERRFLLKAEVIRGKEVIHQQVGLNDVVLLPGDVAHMIEFSIVIDKELVCLQRADGLIVATPTGSTAYALSGGGPILHPQLEAVVLVPMFPHKLTSRPIVINSNSKIEIMVNKRNEISPRLSCDGQPRLTVKPGDSIHIRKKTKPLRLIHAMNYQYFATLRDKLQWETKP